MEKASARSRHSKEHVGINFFAPPAADIDSASIQRWLKAAVAANA